MYNGNIKIHSNEIILNFSDNYVIFKIIFTFLLKYKEKIKYIFEWLICY